MESERVTQKNCQIPAELESEGLCAALEPTFGIRLGEVVRAKATFYDTFEWGIWFGRRLLYQSEGQLRLCERDHDWIGDLRRAIANGGTPGPAICMGVSGGRSRRRAGAARRYSRSDARRAALGP